LFVTAHYDHLGRMGTHTYFPGANDNASGTAFMLLLMEHYMKKRPDYTMVFIAFGAEEAGLIGSKYYTQNPIYPLKDLRFLLNLDLMGNGQEGITVVNATVFKNDFKRLADLNKQTDWFTQIKTRGEAANSDHYWFTKAGVPSFFIYTLGGSTAYHDVHDTHQAIEFPKIQELMQLCIQFLDETK
jgi:Zn-dependent M28 family amino/carboxypeptidase